MGKRKKGDEEKESSSESEGSTNTGSADETSVKNVEEEQLLHGVRSLAALESDSSDGGEVSLVAKAMDAARSEKAHEKVEGDEANLIKSLSQIEKKELVRKKVSIREAMEQYPVIVGKLHSTLQTILRAKTKKKKKDLFGKNVKCMGDWSRRTWYDMFMIACSKELAPENLYLDRELAANCTTEEYVVDGVWLRYTGAVPSLEVSLWAGGTHCLISSDLIPPPMCALEAVTKGIQLEVTSN